MTWRCPQCGVAQNPNDVRTTEIIEPGRERRIEFFGLIRPSFDGTYSCLVCGYAWNDVTPATSAVTFLHPVNEQSSCCADGCRTCSGSAS